MQSRVTIRGAGIQIIVMIAFVLGLLFALSSCHSSGLFEVDEVTHFAHNEVDQKNDSEDLEQPNKGDDLAAIASGRVVPILDCGSNIRSCVKQPSTTFGGPTPGRSPPLLYF